MYRTDICNRLDRSKLIYDIYCLKLVQDTKSYKNYARLIIVFVNRIVHWPSLIFGDNLAKSANVFAVLIRSNGKPILRRSG